MQSFNHLVILLLLFTYQLHSQNINITEKQLCKDLDRIEYWDEQKHSNAVAWDSLETANITFDKHLLEALNTNEATLHYDFPLLSKRIGIISSPDKKLRSYSRDTSMGGTMKDYQTIFQYKANNKTYAKIMTGSPEDEVYYCDKIYSLEHNGTTIYMPVLFYTESSMYHVSGVKFFYIDSTDIHPVELIKNEEGLQNQLWLEYVNPYINNQSKLVDKILQFDPVQKTIKIVKTGKKLNLTGRYTTYKFNGSYFEKIKG